MTVLEAAIERLPQAQLTAPPYQRFARATFGQTNWDAHVRYCRWLYQRNPHWTDDQRLPIYTCRDDDDIVAIISESGALEIDQSFIDDLENSMSEAVSADDLKP
ncbi:MAG: hypothetical protein IIB99_09595 [Planctomycetes bacterium]|nr:hypothetical protein [Planctomycetota bacterium]